MVEQYDITVNTGFRGAKKRPKREKNESDKTWYYLGLVGQIGYVVAIPIAGGAIIGSLVGHTFIGIFVGFVLSAVGFVRVIQKIIQSRK